jgi:hypothetical protein
VCHATRLKWERRPTWYSSDLPAPVGMMTKASRPARTQFTTFLWLGLNSSCLNTVQPSHIVSGLAI